MTGSRHGSNGWMDRWLDNSFFSNCYTLGSNTCLITFLEQQKQWNHVMVQILSAIIKPERACLKFLLCYSVLLWLYSSLYPEVDFLKSNVLNQHGTCVKSISFTYGIDMFLNMYFIHSQVRGLFQGSVIITPRLSFYYLPSLAFSSLSLENITSY